MHDLPNKMWPILSRHSCCQWYSNMISLKGKYSVGLNNLLKSANRQFQHQSFSGLAKNLTKCLRDNFPNCTPRVMMPILPFKHRNEANFTRQHGELTHEVFVFLDLVLTHFQSSWPKLTILWRWETILFLAKDSTTMKLILLLKHQLIFSVEQSLLFNKESLFYLLNIYFSYLSRSL